MSRQRVGLNLLWLVPGVVGGSEEYTTRLLSALSERPPEDVELVLFGNELVFRSYPELAEDYETVVAPVSGRSKGLRVLAESTWLAHGSRRSDVALVHHLGGIMPLIRGRPGMLTIHDLQPLVMPEHFAPVKRRFSRLVIPASARKALVVVTLTEVTRSMMVEHLGVPEERIVVIPAGIHVPSEEELETERAIDVRERYGFGDRPFFLYPAITYPHKNHRFLLEAFAPIAREQPEVLLVLTGGAAQMEGALMDTIRRLGIWRQVHRLGRIPRHHLDAMYHEATALVFPSRFEGFGIPVLEAMSRSCPVLAAASTALPEVGGDAAVLLPLDDAVVWTDEMRRLLEDPAHRRDLAARGRPRASQFGWPHVAERLGALYREVLGEL